MFVLAISPGQGFLASRWERVLEAGVDAFMDGAALMSSLWATDDPSGVVARLRSAWAAGAAP